MSTNSEVIADALREIGIIAEGETLSAEKGTRGLRALNEMLEGWTERDIELGYFAQSSTADDCPIPAWANELVKSHLAIALAPTYTATVSPELAVKARDAFQMAQRKCMAEKMRPADMSHLPLGEGHGSTFNITTG